MEHMQIMIIKIVLNVKILVDLVPHPLKVIVLDVAQMEDISYNQLDNVCKYVRLGTILSMEIIVVCHVILAVLHVLDNLILLVHPVILALTYKKLPKHVLLVVFQDIMVLKPIGLVYYVILNVRLAIFLRPIVLVVLLPFSWPKVRMLV